MPAAPLPLPLTLSWPIYEGNARLSLGGLWDPDQAEGSLSGLSAPQLAGLGIGIWSCDLRTDELRWSAPVYELFGFARDAVPSRNDTVARYAEHSRVKMERLRAYAIRHRRGFTLDAQIMPACGGPARMMRLIAAPVLEAERPVSLRGIKLDVTREYR